MIVEFVGSTGAGKTTLIREIKKKLSKSVCVATPYERISKKIGMQTVTHRTVQNIVQEVAGFPFFLRSLFRHGDFAIFTLRILARQSNINVFTINNMRSFERKMGVYEINKRNIRNQISLVDEGTVLLAHNLFVFNEIQYSLEDIHKFATLVPLPDRIIYVRAPIEELVRRSLQRGDPPRELNSKTKDSVEKYIRRAVQMFDELTSHDRIQSRTLSVDNTNLEAVDSVVDKVCEFILQQKNLTN